MTCPKCGGIITIKKDHCERCGLDITLYKKIIMASNAFYNEGLVRARVNDLSGATVALKKSLELNKKNTNARNLQGLIFYQMGESVAALSEWAISKHFQNEENDADDYIASVHSSPTKLDSINQIIKKYNTALLSAKQGNDDLAIIQLKKVISSNPNYIRALQLLALLYIKNGDQEKAKRCLINASRIDVSNTTTLRYLSELGNKNSTVTMEMEQSSRPNKQRKIQDLQSPNPSIQPISSYKEEKPNILAFINLVIGIMIGVAVVFYLIIPTIKKNAIDEAKANQIDYSEQISIQQATIDTLQKKNKSMEEQVNALNKELDELVIDEFDETIYDNLFNGIKYYVDGDKVQSARTLARVNISKIENKIAQKLYEQIKKDTFVSVSVSIYEEGHVAYTNRKYEDAVKLLKESLSLDQNNVDALYFLGRSYHQLNEVEKAKESYNKIIKDFADSARASEARSRLAELS